MLYYTTDNYNIVIILYYTTNNYNIVIMLYC